MAIAYVNKATQADHDAQSGTVAVTLNSVTSGNCLVLVASVFNVSNSFTITSVTDSASNTYTVRSAVETATDASSRSYAIVAYATNVTGGNITATVTLSGATASQTYAVLGLAEFSGVALSSAEDTWDANDNIDTSAADITAGPITTTEDDALIIGVADHTASEDTSLAWSSPASWTNLYRRTDGWNAATGHDSGYWLPGSIQTTYTPAWSHFNYSGSPRGAGVVVALKASNGGSTAHIAAAYLSMLGAN